jgi:hypothetical protein
MNFLAHCSMHVSISGPFYHKLSVRCLSSCNVSFQTVNAARKQLTNPRGTKCKRVPPKPDRFVERQSLNDAMTKILPLADFV